MASNTKPNFSAAYSKANEILVKSRVISTFPFSPIDLVKEQSAIKCRTYKKDRKYGIDITAFGSESATIFEYGGRIIHGANDYGNLRPFGNFKTAASKGQQIVFRAVSVALGIKADGRLILFDYFNGVYNSFRRLAVIFAVDGKTVHFM